ncbi:MAG TPA: AmmeMemoRadiSam system protein B, partial [Bacteroidota bacterium]|nr:AmmeMemoRadiSam system protein B [Bacteroidota bacterium]
ARTLQRDVDEMLERAVVPRQSGTLFAIVSPHAGYMYSGFTAAHGYSALKGTSFDAVIVVGPSHQEYFDGIAIYPGSSYRTPLGEVPVHQDVRTQLVRGGKRISLSVAGHRTEHSVEVQVPFLQRALGAFSFVPVVMGDQSPDLCTDLADAIVSAAAGRRILLVASSDLSHYHPYTEAVALDRRVIDLVESFEPLRLLESLEHRHLEACGGGPIVAVMLAAQRLGANTARVVHYCNSGDVTGDRGAVVGYLSAILTNEPPGLPPRVN